MKIGDRVDAILELKDFYDKIKNPIDDDKVLDTIVEAYSKSSNHSGSLKRILQKMQLKKKDSGFIDSKDRRVFEKAMRDFLNRGYIRLNKKTSWTRIESCFPWIKYEYSANAKHIFCLNVDSKCLYLIVTDLIKLFVDAGLPFCVEFDEFGKRVDNIVIYTPTKYLLKNLQILRQLKLNHLPLMKYFYKPSLLTGKIDDNIGYITNSNQISYLDLMLNIINAALRNATIDWVLANQDYTIKDGGKNISLKEYIIKKKSNLSKKSLDEMVKKLSLKIISTNCQSYLNFVRHYIKEESSKKGVDPDKFVFDKKAVSQMKRQSQINMIKFRRII